MTEAQSILANLILLKCPIGTSFGFQGPAFAVQKEIQAKYAGDLLKEMNEILLNKDAEIRQILLDNQYLECVDSRIPKDKLTLKGIKAKELEGIKQYEEWERRNMKIEKNRDIPYKYWIPYQLVIIVVTASITTFINNQCTQTSAVKAKEPNHLQSPLNKEIDSSKISTKPDSV